MTQFWGKGQFPIDEKGELRDEEEFPILNEENFPELGDYQKTLSPEDQEILHTFFDAATAHMPAFKDIGRTPVFGEIQNVHRHVYTFHLNNAHTLVRGCSICGSADVTLCMGEPENLIWHHVGEKEEVQAEEEAAI